MQFWFPKRTGEAFKSLSFYSPYQGCENPFVKVLPSLWTNLLTLRDGEVDCPLYKTGAERCKKDRCIKSNDTGPTPAGHPCHQSIPESSALRKTRSLESFPVPYHEGSTFSTGSFIRCIQRSGRSKSFACGPTTNEVLSKGTMKRLSIIWLPHLQKALVTKVLGTGSFSKSVPPGDASRATWEFTATR